MTASPILALIVPVYNEQDNILRLIHKVNENIKIPVKLYVIYDYDEDPTLNIVRNNADLANFEIETVKNKHGRGVLNAIKTGFETFAEEACIVIMADGSDDLSSVNGMYGLFCQGFHIVCGSRYMRNGKQIGGSLFKVTLSKLAGKSLYWFTKIPTHDVTNSFKLYTKKALSMIDIESAGGFEIGMEITVKAHVLGLAISEVPTIWRDRFEGTSKFKLWQWLPHYLKWYFFLLIRRPLFFRNVNVEYNRTRPVGY